MLLHLLLRRVSLVIIALLLSALLPMAGANAQTSQRCFTETNLCISGRLRSFWEQNGGLPVFGLPITPQREESIEGRPFQVQWFERNRLELHPENAQPYDVLLGRLGVDRLAKQGRDWFVFPKTEPQGGCRFFPETGHNVCGRILAAWRASGLEQDGRRGKSEAENLALFGLPLSDAQQEAIEGKEYTVQWFERGRFELHPENQPPFDSLLGLLGSEVHGPPEPAPAAPAPAPVATGGRWRIGIAGAHEETRLTCSFTGTAIQPQAGYTFLVLDLKISYLNGGQAGQIQTQTVTVADKSGASFPAEGSGIPDCVLGRGTHLFYEDEQSVSFLFVLPKDSIGQAFKLQFPGVAPIAVQLKTK